MSKDTIYSEKLNQVEQFQFDENVASVFPDMLKRSVPGYDLIQEMIAVLSRHYVQSESNIYDLGCSLGASSISMLSQANQKSISLIAIDNSRAMTESAQKNLALFCEKNNIVSSYDVICEDIINTSINNASIVNLNFTLQFIQTDARQALIEKIYRGLKPGGILILSEKVELKDDEDQIQHNIHHEFKRINGYSELEISQKRSALEGVLVRDSEAKHHERILASGFSKSITWFQCFNFMSFLAIK